jgi:ATP-dependent helicase/nuclease subunit B
LSLYIRQVRHSIQRKKIFDEQIQKIATGDCKWIVSDLRSKFEIQKELLDYQDWYQDHFCLRASELWNNFFKRLNPDYKEISKEFLASWIKDQLSFEENISLQNSNKTVLDFMDLMVGPLSHPQGSPLIADWFKENPEAIYRWGGWHARAQDFFSLLQKNKFYLQSWTSALLSNEADWLQLEIAPNYFFDLGSEIKRSEVELILKLSEKADVTVIEPLVQSDRSLSHLLKPYELLRNSVVKKNTLISEETKSSSPKISAVKVSGTLSEVKLAVQTARKWIDQEGVAPEKISIISANIESYWPILSPYLSEEGLPFDKTITTRLHSYPQIAAWYSRLKILTKKISYRDLEMTFFNNLESQSMRFEDFESLFKKLLDESDLERLKQIETFYKTNKIENKSMTRLEFLTLSLLHLKSPDLNSDEPVEIVIREFLKFPSHIYLSWDSWLMGLEQIISKKEIIINQGHPKGIQISQIMAADSWNLSHRIFLGLSENQFKKNKQSLISVSEIESLANSTGFILDHPEQTSLEFELLWLLSANTTESFLVYPATSFDSGIESPHVEWLKRVKTENLMLTPNQTRMDSVQSVLADKENKESLEQIANMRNWGAEKQNAITIALNEDLGVVSLRPLSIEKTESLSPTSIEKYIECPFVYAAEKIYGLLDKPELDLDPEARVKGQLLHLMLERLIDINADQQVRQLNSQKLHELLEEIRPLVGLDKIDNGFWQIIKNRHVKIGQKFIKFEIDWRTRFPKTKTLFVEKKFSYPIDKETNLIGKIDRIDSDRDKNIVLLDYKMSDNHSSFNSWLKNNELQLGFYILALEEGISAEWGFQTKPDVVGALYYSLKAFNRKTGLKTGYTNHELYEVGSSRSLVSEEDKNKFLTELKQIIISNLGKIKSGLFAPVPKDKKNCATCKWSVTCRAPHLN